MSSHSGDGPPHGAPSPLHRDRASYFSVLLIALAIQLTTSGTVARAGWEYPGSRAEIFSLDRYLMEDDPEGVVSCTDGYGGMLVATYDTLG